MMGGSGWDSRAEQVSGSQQLQGEGFRKQENHKVLSRRLNELSRYC